jgi:hypothetical protein
METLQWLKYEDVWKNNLTIWSNASHHAASGGHLHVLQWLVDNGDNLNCGTYIGAAKNGHLHILKWLYNKFIIDYSNASTLAAQSGHLNVIEWAIECDVKGGCEIKSNIWTNVAAYHGHLHILVWATEHNYELSENCLDSSISGGHLHVLKWLLDLGFKITEHSCYRAVREEKIDVLQLICDTYPEWAPICYDKAYNNTNNEDRYVKSEVDVAKVWASEQMKKNLENI